MYYFYYKFSFIAYVFIAFQHNCALAEFICYKRSPEVSHHKCCPLPQFYKEEIKEKCNSNKDHFKIEATSEHHCFISCAVDAIGFLNSDSFEEHILNSYLDTALEATPDVVPIVKEAFKQCLNKYEIMFQVIRTKGPCAFYHILLMDCVVVETFKKCPESLWLNTNECNEARNYWSICLENNL